MARTLWTYEPREELTLRLSLTAILSQKTQKQWKQGLIKDRRVFSCYKLKLIQQPKLVHKFLLPQPSNEFGSSSIFSHQSPSLLNDKEMNLKMSM